MTLTDRLWNAAARTIATRPALVDALLRYSSEKPYFAIGEGGDIYMARAWAMPRWSLMDRGDGILEPKSWHRRAWSWLPSIRMHHILRADKDRHLHDHPAGFRSLILRGGYYEDTVFAGPRPLPLLRDAGTSYRSPAKRMHRISCVAPEGALTLVIWSPKRQTNSWGFLVNGAKVPWREHIRAEHSID